MFSARCLWLSGEFQEKIPMQKFVSLNFPQATLGESLSVGKIPRAPRSHAIPSGEEHDSILILIDSDLDFDCAPTVGGVSFSKE